MSRSRPYPYGTVLRVTESFAGARGFNANVQRRRRFMVISDTGLKDVYAISAVAIVTEYDDDYVPHNPNYETWEPVDE